MAVVQNPIIGRARQKYGNTIFQKWKQQNVIRTKPLEVSNPRSPKQLFNRAAMTLLVALGRPILDLIRIGFAGQATNMTEWNRFIQVNRSNAITGSSIDDVAIDMNSVSIAQGTLLIPGYEAYWENEAGSYSLVVTSTDFEDYEDSRNYFAIFASDGTLKSSGTFSWDDNEKGEYLTEVGVAANDAVYIFTYNPLTNTNTNSVVAGEV